MKSHVTRSAEECQELTASRNFIRTNRFGSRITRRRRRRHAVAWRLEFQGLFQVSNIEERHDIRQTWKSSHEPTPFFPPRKFPANRISLTDEGTLNRFRRLLVPLLEEYIEQNISILKRGLKEGKIRIPFPNIFETELTYDPS